MVNGKELSIQAYRKYASPVVGQVITWPSALNKPCRPDQETPGASESPPQAAPVTGDSGITANTNKSYGEWMHAPRRQLRHRDTT
jgi:hypothetical protein